MNVNRSPCCIWCLFRALKEKGGSAYKAFHTSHIQHNASMVFHPAKKKNKPLIRLFAACFSGGLLNPSTSLLKPRPTLDVQALQSGQCLFPAETYLSQMLQNLWTQKQEREPALNIWAKVIELNEKRMAGTAREWSVCVCGQVFTCSLLPLAGRCLWDGGSWTVGPGIAYGQSSRVCTEDGYHNPPAVRKEEKKKKRMRKTCLFSGLAPRWWNERPCRCSIHWVSSQQRLKTLLFWKYQLVHSLSFFLSF